MENDSISIFFKEQFYYYEYMITLNILSLLFIGSCILKGEKNTILWQNFIYIIIMWRCYHGFLLLSQSLSAPIIHRSR